MRLVVDIGMALVSLARASSPRVGVMRRFLGKYQMLQRIQPPIAESTPKMDVRLWKALVMAYEYGSLLKIRASANEL
jgi:hypothetical protein